MISCYSVSYTSNADCDGPYGDLHIVAQYGPWGSPGLGNWIRNRWWHQCLTYWIWWWHKGLFANIWVDHTGKLHVNPKASFTVCFKCQSISLKAKAKSVKKPLSGGWDWCHGNCVGVPVFSTKPDWWLSTTKSLRDLWSHKVKYRGCCNIRSMIWTSGGVWLYTCT